MEILSKEKVLQDLRRKDGKKPNYYFDILKKDHFLGTSRDAFKELQQSEMNYIIASLRKLAKEEPGEQLNTYIEDCQDERKHKREVNLLLEGKYTQIYDEMVGRLTKQLKAAKMQDSDSERGEGKTIYQSNKSDESIEHQNAGIRFVPRADSDLQMTIFDLSFIVFILYCILVYLGGYFKKPIRRISKFLKQISGKIKIALSREEMTFQSHKLKLKKALADSQKQLSHTKDSSLKYVK